MRNPLLIAVVLAVMAVGSTAQALTLSDWAQSPIQNGDKILTYVSGTLPMTIGVSLSQPFSNTYIMTLSLSTLQCTGQYLNYTIAVDQAISPNDCFDQVSFDTSNVFGTTLVTKTIFEPDPDLVLTSSNGYPSALVSVPGNLKFLTVRLNFTGGGYLGGTLSDSYSQKVVPEPSSIFALLGGLGSLLAFRRRRA